MRYRRDFPAVHRYLLWERVAMCVLDWILDVPTLFGLYRLRGWIVKRAFMRQPPVTP